MTADPTSSPADLPPKYVPADVEPAITQRWDDAKAYAANASDAGKPYAICIPPPNVTAALHLGHALNNTLQDVLTRAARMKRYNTVWIPGTDHAGIATQTVVDKRLQATGQKALKDYKLEEAQKAEANASFNSGGGSGGGGDSGGGREAFIEKVSAWKDEYEARITQQLKDMGCSCDWNRQAFTMDEPRAEAVREAFFRLFKDGLIYRGKRLVNWDPVTQTALADDEVEMHDVDGHFWYMKYPIVKPADSAALSAGSSTPAPGTSSEKSPANNSTAWIDTGEFVTVATTRPETMLGDTAVAVNPDDPRNKSFIGQYVRLPIVNRIIPIIGDDYVVIADENSDDAKARMASGFLKVTPAHDQNDYDIGQRHDLPIINIMAPDASISKDHGWPAEEWDTPPQGQAASAAWTVDDFANTLLSLSREDARRAIVRWFKENDLLADQKPYRHAVGHSYRSHVPIEPYYSDQWYLKVTDDKLKGAALRAMDESQRAPSEDPAFTTTPSRKPADGAAPSAGSPTHSLATGLKFTPPRYAKTFQSWHENIRDWCISRQLWWGHRIPVWHKNRIARGERERKDLCSSFEKWEEEGRISTSIRKIKDGSWDDSDSSNFFVCVRHDDREVIEELEQDGFFTQDPDVLDTWFSSALWPMSTLGWPEKTPDLELWNPTSLLCTAREIITLWVSRMVMFNLYFLDQLPFTDVFIHAMIQDGHGQKMSKSLGNGVDPIDIIHSHGSDAMRFTLTSMTTQTQDVRLPVDTINPHTGETFTPKFITGPGGYKVAAPIQEHPPGSGQKMVSSYGLASGKEQPTEAGGDMPLARNTSEKFDVGQRFATKLWNATRFALSNIAEAEPDAAVASTSIADRWILSRTVHAIEAADRALENYDFHNYANGLYQFVWNEVCDWYVEAIKPTIKTPEGAKSRQVLAAVLDVSLRLLHPVMPFVTERLWEALCEVCPKRGVEGLDPNESDLLVTAEWPGKQADGTSVVDRALIDRDAEERFARLQEVVGMIREVRSGAKVPPREVVDFSLRMSEDHVMRITPQLGLIEALTKIKMVAVGPDVEKPDGAATITGPMGDGFLHIQIDTEAEAQRLTARKEELEKSVKTLDGRLGNEKYTSKAPAHLVQQTRDQRRAAAAELERVVEQLSQL